MAESVSMDLEKRVKRVKRSLEGWRALVLQARSVLLWQEPWHPAFIVAVLGFVYVLLWLLDPGALTLIAGVGLMINLVDFIVPLVTARLTSVGTWTGAQEKQLEDTCRSLVMYYSAIECQITSLRQMRKNKPLMYYAVSSAGLFVLLWLGRSVNDTHLVWAVVTVLCLLPGALQRFMPQRLLTLTGHSSSSLKKEK